MRVNNAKDNSTSRPASRKRRRFLTAVALLFRGSAVEAWAPSTANNNGCCVKTVKPSVNPKVTTPPQPDNNAVNNNAMLNSLDAFAQMRSGISPNEQSGATVFWTADGELYETPSGKMLARMEGLETSRAVRLEDDEENAIRIFSRKLVWFLDPETNEIMEEFEGQAVPPIRFDAQVFDVQQTANSNANTDPSLSPIQPYVVRSKRLIPCMPITPRWGGCQDILMFQVPLFIDIEIPIMDSDKTRKYQAWEFYDYSLNVQDSKKNPPVLSWTRQGSTPPFCLNGNGVTHARGHRVDSFEELPQSIQDYVNKNYPLFRGPPQSMDEVDKLLGDN